MVMTHTWAIIRSWQLAHNTDSSVSFKLGLDQSGTSNRGDETMNILYRKYILDGTNVLSAHIPSFTQKNPHFCNRRLNSYFSC